MECDSMERVAITIKTHPLTCLFYFIFFFISFHCTCILVCWFIVHKANISIIYFIHLLLSASSPVPKVHVFSNTAANKKSE